MPREPHFALSARAQRQRFPYLNVQHAIEQHRLAIIIKFERKRETPTLHVVMRAGAHLPSSKHGILSVRSLSCLSRVCVKKNCSTKHEIHQPAHCPVPFNGNE